MATDYKLRIKATDQTKAVHLKRLIKILIAHKML